MLHTCSEGGERIDGKILEVESERVNGCSHVADLANTPHNILPRGHKTASKSKSPCPVFRHSQSSVVVVCV